VDVNIDTLVANQFPSLAAQFLGSTSPDVFTVHGDDAPPFYLANFGGGPLGQTDPLTRQFERSMAQLTAVNPYTGATDHLLVQMGDQTEMKALHMITTGDPARNATFVFFGDPTYYITDFPSSTSPQAPRPAAGERLDRPGAEPPRPGLRRPSGPARRPPFRRCWGLGLRPPPV